MLRPVRNGIINRIALLLLLVLFIALIGVWRFISLIPASPQATPVAGNRPDQGILDKALFDAIRDGDRTQVQQLLQDGANVNARDEAGDTALMRAALDADVEMMRVLVESGAEV
ncbi:MAG TPA: ankyrin repeat domain-containing protein, partial [Gemmataceae bacterium]|nr:ankyrin repeat domain-containing protein [Gemmataceae bacterium]